MHLKHACLPISPPEQAENETYFIIFIGHAQGGIFILCFAIVNAILIFV